MFRKEKPDLPSRIEIRKIFHAEVWWFSIVNVVTALTDSTDSTQYIKKMRKRDPELDVNWGTVCTLLPLLAPDGKTGGGIAKKARRELEEKTGRTVVSTENYLSAKKTIPLE